MVQATSLAQGRGKWPRMSYEQYLGDPTIPEATEWVDGEVIEISPVSRDHSRTVGYLIGLVGSYLDVRPIGELLGLPFQMKTSATLPGRSPDLLVVLNEHAGRFTSKNLDAPADLVVEVLDTGSELLDRGVKFYEYERGGVSEYWLLDPHRKVADFYSRDARGYFRNILPESDGTFASTVLPGLRLNPDWLWSRRSVRAVMRDLGLDD